LHVLDRPADSDGGAAIGGSPAWVLEHVPNEIEAPDFTLFRDILQGHYYPAKVEALDHRVALRAPRLSAVELSHLTIGYVRFGTTVSIDAGDLLAYHVDVPLQGTVASQCGDQATIASATRAAVFSPHNHTYIERWEEDAAQLLIKMERHSVESELSGLLGRPIAKPIQFQLPMPIASGPGQAWLTTLASLLTFVDSGPLTGPPALRHVQLLERSLISGLLLSQPHTYTDALRGEPRAAAPTSSLDRVVEAITTSPEQPYTLADLCRIASLSARSLQYAFHERFNLTPMQFLRQVRLDRSFEDLKDGRGSVSDIAFNWGFSNLGRFARTYQQRFGELPSTTAERAAGQRRVM